MKKIKYSILAWLILTVTIFSVSSCAKEVEIKEYSVDKTMIYHSANDGYDGIEITDSNTMPNITATKFDLNLTNDKATEKVTINYNGVDYPCSYKRSSTYQYNRKIFDEYFSDDTEADKRFYIYNGKSVGATSILSYGDYLISRPKESDEVILEKAKAFIEKYVDLSVYEKYKVIQYSVDCSVIFYNEINGIMVGDYARTNAFDDGTVMSGYAVPDKEIYEVYKVIDFNADECDKAALEKMTSLYNKTVERDEKTIKFEYSSHELTNRILTLDDENNPIIIYSYKVEYTKQVNDKEPNPFADFIDVVVSLAEKK